MTRAFADYFCIPPVVWTIPRHSERVKTLAPRGFASRQSFCSGFPSQAVPVGSSLSAGGQIGPSLCMLLLFPGFLARTGPRRVWRQQEQAREIPRSFGLLNSFRIGSSFARWHWRRCTGSSSFKVSRESHSPGMTSLSQYSLHCRSTAAPAASCRSTASRAKDVSHQVQKCCGFLCTCARCAIAPKFISPAAESRCGQR